jgi:hypothetical protein
MAQKSDVEAIEEAYRAKLNSLFDLLVRTMMDWSDEANGEQRSLDQFNTGLRFARRARELALAAVTPQDRMAASRAERTNI